VDIDPDAFVAEVCASMRSLYTDTFNMRAAVSRDNLNWIGEYVCSAPPASYFHPRFRLRPELEVRARVEQRFGALLRCWLAAYKTLSAMVRLIPSATLANSVYEWKRAQWLRTHAVEAWRQTVPTACRHGGIGRDDRWSACLMIEKLSHRIFLARACRSKDSHDWSEPATFPDLPAAAYENLSYVAGWVASSVQQKLCEKAWGRSATTLDMSMQQLVLLLRYDGNPNLPAELRRQQGPNGLIEAVERKPGALYRPTQEFYSFVLRLEILARHWLRFERLQYYGREFLPQVLQHLVDDETAQGMFVKCFPPDLGMRLERQDASQLVDHLRELMIGKLMRSRAKYFTQDATDRLRKRLSARQTTKQKVQAAVEAAIAQETRTKTEKRKLPKEKRQALAKVQKTQGTQ
jgi:hypothetical protein